MDRRLNWNCGLSGDETEPPILATVDAASGLAGDGCVGSKCNGVLVLTGLRRDTADTDGRPEHHSAHTRTTGRHGISREELVRQTRGVIGALSNGVGV